MILREIEASKSAKQYSASSIAIAAKPRAIWDALLENQQRLTAAAGEQGVWLITQPSHSNLSGDIAAKLRPAVFGTFDEHTVRAIALHDAGWSGFDSDLIRASRDSQQKKAKMVSFVAVPPDISVKAWSESIETALKITPLGGYLVSEHFRSIAEMLSSAKPESAKPTARFIAQETARQQKLRPKIGLVDAAIQRLVEGLRFCDLLSLYLCAGLTEIVEFPQQFQQHSFTIRPAGHRSFRLSPSPFAEDETFSFAA